jgi:fatty-acyl-CoA synthase
VVLRPGAAADAEALKAHVATELARFKLPREVIFADALPRNAMGKVQHFRLRQRSS